MNQIVNPGRQKEFDIARGLAVIFMVLIHTTQYYWNGENEIYGAVANFLGAPPAAPVFMFLLGCGIIYSRHNCPDLLVRRGIKLFLLSYVFNALVFALPFGIAAIVRQDPEIWNSHWHEIYAADILQFVAMSFLFFALVRKLNLSSLKVLAIAVVITLAGNALTYFKGDVSSPWLQAVTGLLWGTHLSSYFPFTSWVLYVTAGYAFADHLQRVDNKKRLYWRLAPVSAVVGLALTAVIVFFYPDGYLTDETCYYHEDIVMNLAYIAFILFWLGICYWLSGILPEGICNLLGRFSRNVTPIYVIHYALVLYISALITGGAVFNAWIVVAITAVYITLAYLGAAAYKKATLKLKNKQ